MKLVIHLKEACEAIIETAKSMQTAHNDLFDKEHFRNQKPHPSIPATSKDLEYLLSSFHGLGLRIRSVETRASNVINLVSDDVQILRSMSSNCPVSSLGRLFRD